MTLSRRHALKHMLSAVALGGIGSVPAPAKAFADGTKSAEVNVVGYGATGDGTTNDTAAIHAARDAAGVGGKVIFPSGSYIVSGLTANVENQTWELTNGSIVKMALRAPRIPPAVGATKIESADILHVTAAGFTVHGGVFDGSAGTQHNWSQQGIRIEADGVTVRNAEVRDSPGSGVYALNCDRVTVADCAIINCYDAGVLIQNSAAGTDMYDMVITGNHVESSLDSAHGIGVVGGASVSSVNMPVHRVTVSDNTVSLPWNPTTESSCIGVTNCTDWLVSDNNVAGSALGISCPNPVRATITNNRVIGFREYGIEIPGNVTDCLVSKNVIDAAGVAGAGAGIQNSQGTVKELRITDNSISGFVGYMSGISFATKSKVESATVAGNVITGNCNKFIGLHVNHTASNLRISGNTFDAGCVSTSINAIYFAKNEVSNTAIVGNIFTSTSSAGVNNSIAFNVDATASGITVTDNTIKAGQSAGFAAFYCYSSATNIVFTGNSVNAGKSTLSNGIDLHGSVDGFIVSGNEFSNLTEAVIRLMASTAVTMKNIKLVGNRIVNVPYRIRNRNSGGAVVESSVFSTDN